MPPTKRPVKGVPGHVVPGRRTQAERRSTTRAALIAAARALFAERGFAGTGREEIVERAGVTRGAMYHHFGSKEDLFRAVYEAVEDDVTTAVAAAAAPGKDPMAQLRLGALAFLEVAAQPDVRRIVLIDAPSVLPVPVRRELSKRYGLGLVRAGLSAAMDAELIAAQPVDPLAHLLLAALHEAATLVADGADRAEVAGAVEGLLSRL